MGPRTAESVAGSGSGSRCMTHCWRVEERQHHAAALSARARDMQQCPRCQFRVVRRPGSVSAGFSVVQYRQGCMPYCYSSKQARAITEHPAGDSSYWQRASSLDMFPRPHAYDGGERKQKQGPRYDTQSIAIIGCSASDHHQNHGLFCTSSAPLAILALAAPIGTHPRRPSRF